MLTLATLILGLSCSLTVDTSPSGDSISGSDVSNPVISITYFGKFAGQTASGYLRLLVDITIENGGYEGFNISPDSFSVNVSNYSYPCAENDLKTVNLQNGEKINGRLTFLVPPEAATTKTGYRLEHAEQLLHNIKWLKQIDSSVPASTSNAAVSITYSDTYMWVKETGSLYLLVDMTIENVGYESFNTSPEYFTLVIGNILGQTNPIPPISYDGLISNERDGAYSDLRTFDLQNGGKLSGSLAFKVPAEILSSTERYRIDYSGVRSYNIMWFWKPPQK